MKKSKIVNEFKKFISRGNILDMAVGIIIGSAFTAIVTSLVNDILMPLISSLIRVDIKDWKITIKPAINEITDINGAIVTPAKAAIEVRYGIFIQAIINFLLIAISIFILVKVINTIREKLKKKEVPTPAPVKEEDSLAVLKDIRSLLDKDKKSEEKDEHI
jgi:large conductance mechanosensitive channel